jgi:pSer/pThr/pTyr-binding forkhead associated (FHA) protein
LAKAFEESAMPKMIVSIDGVVIREVQVTKDRTSVGRRPYNDVVIDNLAVSGEHAIVQMSGSAVYIEDLNSTNGTFINGKAVKKQLLNDSDTVEIGKYKIKYIGDGSADAQDRTVVGMSNPAALTAAGSANGADLSSIPAALRGAGRSGAAAIKVLSGAASGREVGLVKIVTTIGKPGVAVAAITRRPQGFVVAHVEGVNKPTLNGAPISVEPVLLNHGDLLELAGTKMQFVQN